MDKVFFFSFESRTWSVKQCRKVLPPWTYGRAVRRKRSVFAFGSMEGEFGDLEVCPLHPVSADLAAALLNHCEGGFIQAL